MGKIISKIREAIYRLSRVVSEIGRLLGLA